MVVTFLPSCQKISQIERNEKKHEDECIKFSQLRRKMSFKMVG